MQVQRSWPYKLEKLKYFAIEKSGILIHLGLLKAFESLSFMMLTKFRVLDGGFGWGGIVTFTQ